MTVEYGYVGLFLVAGVIFVLAAFLVSRFLRPARPTPEKLAPYECGEEPVGEGQVQFHVRYYLFAMLFVLFDVEAVFLLPWAVAFRRLTLWGLLEMALFLGILGVAYAYAWRKGALEWAS